MAGYIGSTPVPQGIQEQQSFTATAGQTTFNTLGYTDGNTIRVTLNGVLLEGGGVDYTATNGSDIVLTAAASVDDVLTFETFNEFQLVSQTMTTPTISGGTLKSNVTLKNDTEQDTDGGRASKIIYQGEQSGGEISTLAEIQASHDGTADDEKGDLIFRTNDGSDGTSPTERLRIDSLGHVGVNTSSPDSNSFGSGNGILTVASDTGSAKTAMLNLVGDGNDTNNTRVASLFYNDASATGAGATLAGIEAYRASNHATDPGANLIFNTNAGSTGSYAERMRIRAAGGLTFNGDTAEANALNDYEEGTCTINIASSAVNPSFSQGGSFTATYCKIGKTVTVHGYSATTTISSAGTGIAKITGLPFALAPSTYSCAHFTHSTMFGAAQHGYIESNSTFFYPIQNGSTAGVSLSTGTFYFMFTATYVTA